MKRNLIYSVFAALLLASCSSSEDIPEPTPVPEPVPVPETLDAYLSLSLSNGALRTKADAAYGDGEKDGTSTGDPAGTTDINSFTVAIFRGNLSEEAAAVSQPAGSLLYLNTFKTDNTIEKTSDNANKLCVSNIVKDGDEYQINGIKIKAGKIHVLIMANMPDDFLKGKTNITMDDLKKQTYANLENEGFNKDGESHPCSMSSEWLEYEVKPTTDGNVFYLLDGKASLAEEKGEATTDADRVFTPTEDTPIRLYRNVSAVAFKTITLAPSAGWGAENGATLTLKAIFITNAVNWTSMTIGTPVPEEKNNPKPSQYYYGGYRVPGGTNYRGNGTGAILAKVNNNAGLGECLYTDWKNESYSISATGTKSASLPESNSNEPCVGRYFMIYENSEAMKAPEGRRTLITLYADYTYIDKLGEEHTVPECFYTVVINDEKNTGATAGYGTYVGRNYIYNVNLTIVGPGSKNPFIPLYTANATAFIEAADWSDAVNITQPAD